MPTAPGLSRLPLPFCLASCFCSKHSSPERSKVDDLIFLKGLLWEEGGPGMSKMFKLGHLCLAGPVGIWSKCHWNEAGSNTVRPRPFSSGVLVLTPHSLCACGSLSMLLLFAPPPTLSSGFPFPRWLFIEPVIETVCLMPCLFHTILKSTCKPSQSPTGFLYFSCLCWA